MTEAIFTLKLQKPFTMEFDLAIEGTDASSPEVYFVIENGFKDSGNLMFKCKKQKGQTWEVNTPPIDMLAQDSTFYIAVLLNGYFFKPATGQFNVVGTPIVTFVDTNEKGLSTNESTMNGAILLDELPIQPIYTTEIELPKWDSPQTFDEAIENMIKNSVTGAVNKATSTSPFGKSTSKPMSVDPIIPGTYTQMMENARLVKQILQKEPT
jgi:hypothetical protein